MHNLFRTGPVPGRAGSGPRWLFELPIDCERISIRDSNSMHVADFRE
ncbi:hypothetical protein E5Q_06490 [Mixia osmundae IAM 14324]|uniref:Uncharacterized protein n=1 Tax=Mixia osmundae (strain CBS 9802 / IAM 14324 / JCM 22182 / KY 12970) TaxID=764103 RepID=G7EAC7_MIXOS|nr:hypothetical protein E5Q_06490 [Mixia osmundae IAM 14324]